MQFGTGLFQCCCTNSTFNRVHENGNIHIPMQCGVEARVVCGSPACVEIESYPSHIHHLVQSAILLNFCSLGSQLHIHGYFSTVK